jgi:hypothetical protein
VRESDEELRLFELLVEASLASSRMEARRLVEQGAVAVDGLRLKDPGVAIGLGTYVVQVGKRRFARVTISRVWGCRFAPRVLKKGWKGPKLALDPLRALSYVTPPAAGIARAAGILAKVQQLGAGLSEGVLDKLPGPRSLFENWIACGLQSRGSSAKRIEIMNTCPLAGHRPFGGLPRWPIDLSAIMTVEVYLEPSAKFKLESLILAQDERWRRA